MSLESSMKQFRKLAWYSILLCLGVLLWYLWGPPKGEIPDLHFAWIKTAGEVLVPLYMLTTIDLALLYYGQNRLAVVWGRLTQVLIVSGFVLVADYIVSGRYLDEVDLIGGFRHMDFGLPILYVLFAVAVVILHYKGNSWGERKENNK